MKIPVTIYGVGGYDPNHPTGNVVEEVEYEVEDNYELQIREQLTELLGENKKLWEQDLSKEDLYQVVKLLLLEVSGLSRLVLGLVSEHE